MEMPYNKLYVTFNSPPTVKEFLEQFYSRPCMSRVHGVATYLDKSCTVIQCQPAKYRSLDDLFILVKTYYPTCTLEELVNLLFTVKLCSNEFGQYVGFCPGACPDIDNIRVIFNSYNKPFDFIKDIDQYASAYSWETLLNMADIDQIKYEQLTKKQRNHE